MLSEASYPEHHGGAGRCAHVLAAGLVQRGHTVHLLSATEGEYKRERIDGVEVHRVPTNVDRQVPSEQRESTLVEVLLDYVYKSLPLADIDLVHDLGGFLSYHYGVCQRLRADHDIPSIVHFQFLNLAYRKWCESSRIEPFSLGALAADVGFHERVQCFAVRLADAVIAPSYSEAAVIHRLYRPAAGTLSIVPNPVDMKLFPPRPDVEWRARLGSGTPLILFAGRIDDQMKGADLLAHAFARVIALRPDARLVTLGPPQSAGPLMRRFGGAVLALGWVQDARVLARILSAVSIVVVPSRYEPFGLICAEAMAAGVPVVATPVGGLKELIREGYNGLLLPHHSPRYWVGDLAAALLTLLNNPDWAKAMGERGRAHAHRDYRVERVAERIEELHRSVAASARRPARRFPFSPPVNLDRDRYAAIVGRVAGVEARDVASSMPVQYRCLTCTRSLLAERQRTLVELGASSASRAKRRAHGAWRISVRAAIKAACPLGLLQRDFVRMGS